VAYLDASLLGASDTGNAQQLGAGCRFFFGEHEGVALRVEASEVWEKSYDVTKNHTAYVFGFTWRLGD
jgi:hypothetical protein